jgi:hypothetical protein
VSGDLLKRLADAGTPMDLIMEVAETLADARAAQKLLEKRREKDRERKRNPRNSEVSEECAEPEDKGSLQVSPHTPLPKPSKSFPPIPPTDFEERKRAVGACLSRAFPPPLGVSDEQWSAFTGQRRKKFNSRSYLLLNNKLTKLAAAGHDPGALIDLAIERGWETVFEPKEFGGKATTVKPAAKDWNELTTAEKVARTKDHIAFYTRIGRHDDVEECRRRLAALDGNTSSGPVASLINQVTTELRRTG